MAATTPERVRYPALRHRNFVLLWSGLLVSNMGTWMQTVAQSWVIYKLTGNNPLYLGYLGLSFALPMVLIPPIGGVVADRINRIRLLYVTQSCALVLALSLALLTWTDRIQPAYILITTFLGALLLAFDNPTRQTLIPDLVPRDDLLNALALNSATFTGAALVGPAIAGLLLDVVGAGWLFFGNAVSFFAVIGALAAMRKLSLHEPRYVPLREAVLGGFLHAWRDRLILALLVLSALAALFGRSYQQLLPVFADDVWHAGADGYGALLSAGGAGALLGAFAMSSVHEIRAHGYALVASGFIFCAALATFALSPWFWTGVGLLVVVGIAATVFTTMIATLIQLRVPGELRGRVMSLYTTTLIGMPALGALGVAAAARALGPETGSDWTRAPLFLLDLLGVTALTSRLGSHAGAPRALVLGALVLAGILLLTAPMFARVRALGEKHASQASSSSVKQR